MLESFGGRLQGNYPDSQTCRSDMPSGKSVPRGSSQKYKRYRSKEKHSLPHKLHMEIGKSNKSLSFPIRKNQQDSCSGKNCWQSGKSIGKGK